MFSFRIFPIRLVCSGSMLITLAQASVSTAWAVSLLSQAEIAIYIFVIFHCNAQQTPPDTRMQYPQPVIADTFSFCCKHILAVKFPFLHSWLPPVFFFSTPLSMLQSRREFFPTRPVWPKYNLYFWSLNAAFQLVVTNSYCISPI